jgi:YihY family inner membrane protein
MSRSAGRCQACRKSDAATGWIRSVSRSVTDRLPARQPRFGRALERRCHSMPQQRKSQRARRRRSHLLHELARRFSEHELPIYASAIAFRALVAVIPLALLGLGLLGALGLQNTWRDSIAPAIKPRVLPQVYDGINASADKVLSSGTAGLIAFATALVIWDLTIGISAVMRALNHVHDVEERRPLLHRIGVAIGLAVAVGVCIVGAMLLLVVAPRAGGAFHVVLGILRWLVAPLLLGLAVGLLVRFAPAEKPETSWASAGSLLVIAVWDRRVAAVPSLGHLRRGLQGPPSAA